MATRRRPATADDLLTKPLRKLDFEITIPGEKGDQTLSLSLQASGSKAYDDLLAAHPPTKEQKIEGDTYNVNTFGPAIIAAVVNEPKLTLEQATAIWDSETWSGGEKRDLFMGCVNLCQRGLDVPFI